MDEDEWDLDALPVPAKDDVDEALVRFVAMQFLNGKTEKEVLVVLRENGLNESRLPRGALRRLMRMAADESDAMRGLVIARAELNDVEHQRLDSYARRSRAIRRLESVIEEAHGQADSVSKLNQVSFMVAGLIKAQESMDKFTGAQEAAPQVVVNLGYDPMEQFRSVIQREVTARPPPPVIDVVPVEVEDDEA